MRRALLALAIAAAVPVLAQTPPTTVPGTPDAARVKAGTYKVDSAHTQIAWTVNHLGFNAYHGLFGDPTGTLTLDPAKPAAAALSIEIPINRLESTSDALNKHLLSADFFDVAKFPTARFVSAKIDVKGTTARIAGNLTLHGVTKPVLLDARFIGAGDNPMSKAPTVGFEATTTINRSDFGISYGVPVVSDRVELRITAAFEKQG